MLLVQSSALAQRKALRQLVITRWLEKMERRRPELCPVDVSLLLYDIVSTYMTTKKREEGRYLGRGSYDNIRSSIIYLFTMSNTSPPPGFRNSMTTLLKGFTRTIVGQRVEAGESLEEGKEVMSFECLKLLCKKFFEGQNDEYHFAHLFLLLEWNLIARSDNIVHLHVNDFKWESDSLLIFLKRSKHDQEGQHGRTPFHIFFNSENPYLNIGLSLGMYFFSHPGVLSNPKNRLFSARFQYNRYAVILNKVIEDNRAEFEQIGVRPGVIGSHSARKGAATLAASGCTVSPSMASICTRAGWKLGGTRDKYIKFENAGDQYLGRVLCGLNCLTMEFSVSPPFFDLPVSELNEQIDRTIMGIVAGGTRINAATFEVLRMCYACVVFHREFLAEHLDDHNRFRASAALTHMPEVS